MGFIKDVKKFNNSLNSLRKPKEIKGVKFSIVYLMGIKIFMEGFIFPDDLKDSKIFMHFFEQIPVTEEVYVEIHHLILLDNSLSLRDADEEELYIIREKFVSLMDSGRMYLEEIVEVNIPAEEE